MFVRNGSIEYPNPIIEKLRIVVIVSSNSHHKSTIPTVPVSSVYYTFSP